MTKTGFYKDMDGKQILIGDVLVFPPTGIKAKVHYIGGEYFVWYEDGIKTPIKDAHVSHMRIVKQNKFTPPSAPTESDLQDLPSTEELRQNLMDYLHKIPAELLEIYELSATVGELIDKISEPIYEVQRYRVTYFAAAVFTSHEVAPILTMNLSYGGMQKVKPIKVIGDVWETFKSENINLPEDDFKKNATVEELYLGDEK